MSAGETAAFYAELPDGYLIRPKKTLARATRDRWNPYWEEMLRDLYVRGNFGWQRWGSGHMSSGIVHALESRGMIEVATSKRGPNLFRLTSTGQQIGQYSERFQAYADPPADAPTYPHRRHRTLTDDEQYLMESYQDELRAVTEGLARFEEILKGDDAPFADFDYRSRLTRRQAQLNNLIGQLRYDDERAPREAA